MGLGMRVRLLLGHLWASSFSSLSAWVLVRVLVRVRVRVRIRVRAWG